MAYPIAKTNVRMQPLFVDVNNERKKIALWALACSEGRVYLVSFGATTRPLHLTKALANASLDATNVFCVEF